jgi:hypothetical protein
MSERSDTEYFYDDRIKNFDEERLKMTHYINLIKPNQRELHILQWEGIYICIHICTYIFIYLCTYIL